MTLGDTKSYSLNQLLLKLEGQRQIISDLQLELFQTQDENSELKNQVNELQAELKCQKGEKTQTPCENFSIDPQVQSNLKQLIYSIDMSNSALNAVDRQLQDFQHYFFQLQQELLNDR